MHLLFPHSQLCLKGLRSPLALPECQTHTQTAVRMTKTHSHSSFGEPESLSERNECSHNVENKQVHIKILSGTASKPASGQASMTPQRGLCESVSPQVTESAGKRGPGVIGFRLTAH